MTATLLLILAAQYPHPDLLFVEPAASAGLPAYAGIFSNLGALLWVGAGSVALFAGRSNLSVAHLGVFSIYLGLDDLLMIHDRWLPNLIPGYLIEAQSFLFLVYALVLAYLLKAARSLLGTEELLLLSLALALLGGSALLDGLDEWGLAQAGAVVEDSLKFLGLIPWSAFLFSLSKTVSPS